MQKIFLIDVSDIKNKGIDILKSVTEQGMTIQHCVYIPDYKQLLIIAYK